MKADLILSAWNTCSRLVAVNESASKIGMFLDYCVCYALYGCTPSQYERGKFYSLSRFLRRNTMTHKRSLYAQKHYNDPKYVYLLEDKSCFNEHFKEFIKRDWVDSAKMSFEDFEQFVGKHNSFIVKPKKLKQGKGIRTEAIKEDVQKAYNDYVKEDVLLEELIVQHPSVCLNNKSVNTVRVNSILDRNGECHIIKTVLRAGVGNCVVDNYAAGGRIYAVNTELGIVESKGQSKTGIDDIIHPQSDIIMLGYKLPNWDNLQTTVAQAHKLIPQCRYIGWDVAITAEGVELVEGNHKPDYELLEFIGKTQWWQEVKKYW